MKETQSEVLRIEDLGVAISLQIGRIEAVRSASLRILPGKVTALVGESGSGKSVIAQAIMGILPPVAKVTKGRILFSDPATPGTSIDLVALDRESEEYRQLRGIYLYHLPRQPGNRQRAPGGKWLCV